MGRGDPDTMRGMGTTLNSMFEAFNSPPQRHSILIHMPLAIVVLGLLALAVFALTKGRSKVMQRCCMALYALGAVGAWLAAEAGEAAVDVLDVATLSDTAREVIHVHEEMGEKVPLMLAGVFVLLLGTLARNTKVRVTFMVLAMFAAVAAAAYTTVAAHHGGNLVYVHGVGTP